VRQNICRGYFAFDRTQNKWLKLSHDQHKSTQRHMLGSKLMD